MRYARFAACIGPLLIAGGLQAEVITGDLPEDYLRFDDFNAPPGGFGYIPELNVNIAGYSWSGGGFSGITLSNAVNVTFNRLMYLGSGNSGGNGAGGYFLEGQSLASGDGPRDGITFDQVENGFPPPKGDRGLGVIGETQYIGFVIRGDYLPDEQRYEYNYGFVQIFKEDVGAWRVEGWAYETVTDRDLVTFNLVPSPGVLGCAGAGLLMLARRRRS